MGENIMKNLLCLSLLLVIVGCSSNPTSSTKSLTKTYLDSVPDGAKAIYDDYAADPSNSTSEYRLPSGWTSSTPWMQAVANPNLGNSGKVEIDYLYLVEDNSDQTSTDIATDDYESWSSSNGGLFVTSPTWFATNDQSPMEANVANGVMSFDPNMAPGNVWHWWTPMRGTIVPGATSIFLLAKIRITGNACVQAGIDWWATQDASWNGYNVNNKQACVSKWYFNSPDWQTIVLYAKL
jgi:hypothetical protein